MRTLIAGMLVLAMAGAALADPSRTLFVKDDQIAEKYVREAGIRFDSASLPYGGDATAITPYFRYGAFERMDLYVEIPYLDYSSDWYGDVSGAGDVRVGFNLLAHGPVRRGDASIMVCGEVRLATGDEDRGLGTGETTFMVGVGMVSHLTGDLSGIIEGRYVTGPDGKNTILGGIALVNEVGENMALTVEVLNSLVNDDDDEIETAVAVGMIFRNLFDTDAVSVAWSAGIDNIVDDGDTIVAVKGSYEF